MQGKDCIAGPDRIRIALVRHGKEAGRFGDNDPGLTAEGRLQASDAARQLQSHTWKRIVCSPLTRTAQTAAIIEERIGISTEIDTLFAELHPGPEVQEPRYEWQRRTLDSSWNELPEALCDWRNRLYGRIAGVREDTVIVTHFGVINAIVSAVTASAGFFVFAPLTGSVTWLAAYPDGRLVVEKLGASRQRLKVVHAG